MRIGFTLVALGLICLCPLALFADHPDQRLLRLRSQLVERARQFHQSVREQDWGEASRLSQLWKLERLRFERYQRVM